ncbi:MAG: leucine-rich repeat domain-containing protein, partial [Bacteroidales bacterium]|nr:leucine-rich repeat domain-containing protein [Bacteroidales bacterium]
FRHCINLTSVTIPNSVTSIGQMAFRGCTSLTSITIPNNVTFIGDGAFGGCPISTITIPNSVTSISSTAFSSQYITSINVTSGNTKYDSRDNCNAIIETATNTLIMGCKNTEIPNSVTSIGDNAFSGCDVTSITLPNSITSIGKSAFYSCKNLTSLAIPNNVTSIGERAFDGCTSLSSITIPNGVASIGQYAFYECTNLTSITIPNSVTSIGGWAFYNCNGLTSITIPSSVTSIGTCAFQNATNIRKFTCLATNPPTVDKYTFFAKPYGNEYYAPCTLLVPCASVENYKSAEYWDKFNSIECLESETVELTKDEVKVEPERSEAVFTMPQNESANSYTLTIQNNGVTFCTLTFNAQGQLSNIDFSTTKSYELKASVSAYQFTVTGLSEATDYGYSFKALASNKSVLKEYTGSFTTKNGDGTGGSSQGGAEVGGGSGQGGEGGEQGGEGGNQTAINGVSNATTVAIVGNQILVNGEAPAFVVTVSGKKIANANLKAGVYFVVVDGETVGVSVR